MFLAMHFTAIPSYAEKMQLLSIEGDNVTVHYTEGLDEAAGTILDTYPPLMADAARTLGIKLPLSGVNIVVLGEKDFRESAGSDTIMAYAIGKERLSSWI